MSTPCQRAYADFARMVDVFTFKDGKILVKNAYRKDRPAIPSQLTPKA